MLQVLKTAGFARAIHVPIKLCPGMTTHRDFAEKSEQEFECFYSYYSLLGFDPGLEPLSDLSIEPIVKQEGILHLTCNLYTVL